MAHSYIRYQNKSEMFRDSDILIVVGLMREVAKTQADQNLFPILDTWFKSYDEFPSGAIDLKLDTVIHDGAIHSAFMHIIQTTQKIITSQGETVSGNWLSKVLDDGYGPQYRDVASSVLFEKVSRFGSLLS